MTVILLSKNKGISLVCIFPCFIQTDKYHILKIIIDIPLVHYHENKAVYNYLYHIHFGKNECTKRCF